MVIEAASQNVHSCEKNPCTKDPHTSGYTGALDVAEHTFLVSDIHLLSANYCSRFVKGSTCTLPLKHKPVEHGLMNHVWFGSLAWAVHR